jgi:Fibronectin type III domain
MKFTQKTKYFIYGSVATAVLVPLTIFAVETIPVTFSEGDVLSANVLNTVLKRVNDTQRGFTTSNEMNGTWNCKVEEIHDALNIGQCIQNGPLMEKSLTITFVSASNTFSESQNHASCAVGAGTSNGTYAVTGGYLTILRANQRRAYQQKMLNPDRFSTNPEVQSILTCEKQALLPAPADALTATLSGKNVALTWTDQSTDETGFKVQAKTSVKGMWTTATTTGAGATSYTVSGLSAGTYWFRVLATNGNGDAISSSEVQAVVQ